ncbi:Aste57867_8271 [Aphanomyces stellatus]|uniref:Aste57867_8271 protein n=1 Tax=Aphanomyces stellatus TaxID=120398 RepID=A0A485KJV2_9STRA|nr:hypothetical protein As57867_008240 [Aphanomyces stellatus]VFT85158.1 Aste57867_8271 [Aphanomyces stellatus]
MTATIKRYCQQRGSGAFVVNAPACTKLDLKDLVDAALLCLTWYTFERASDLALLRKANFTLPVQCQALLPSILQVDAVEHNLPVSSVTLVDILEGADAGATNDDDTKNAGCATAGVDVAISLHSCRRGGAQYANAIAALSPQWILDRGAWSMTNMTKRFAYIFNTTKEDQAVAKALSGWPVDRDVYLLSMEEFDDQARMEIGQLRNTLFRV